MALSVCVVRATAAKACARAPPDQPGTATENELSAEFGHCLRDLGRSAAAAQYASASLAAVEEITLLRGDFCAAIILADAHMVTSSGSTKGLSMIVSSRIRRTIAIATTVTAIGTGSAAATSSSASAATTGAQHTASPAGQSFSSPVWWRNVMATFITPTETRSVEHKYVDFDTWVQCIAVGVGIDEIRSWIRLEFYFMGPSGRGQWVRRYRMARTVFPWSERDQVLEQHRAGCAKGPMMASSGLRPTRRPISRTARWSASLKEAGMLPAKSRSASTAEGLRVGAATGLPGAMVVRRTYVRRSHENR